MSHTRTKFQATRITAISLEDAHKLATQIATASMYAQHHIGQSWLDKLTIHSINVDSVRLCLNPCFESVGVPSSKALLQITVKPDNEHVAEDDLLLATELVKQAAAETWSKAGAALNGLSVRHIPLKDW